MDTVIRYKCFIASPSDVTEERKEILAAIEDVNREDGKDLGFIVEPVMWENTVPAQGDGGQEVINQQLEPGNQDMFIGVFWSKIGSPTKDFNSGTIEELHLAEEAYAKTGRPQIMLYFCTRALPRDVDVNQLQKVNDLQKVCKDKYLYKEFVSKEQLRGFVRQGIKSCIRKSNGSNPVKCVAAEKGTDDLTASEDSHVHDTLVRDRDAALQFFEGQNIQWIPRRICPADQFQTFSLKKSLDASVDAEEVIEIQEPCIIRAPSGGGLTTLARQLILSAYEKYKKFWAYVDAREVKAREARIEKAIEGYKLLFNGDIECIVIDNWIANGPAARKLFDIIKTKYSGARLIILQSEDDMRSGEIIKLFGLPDNTKMFAMLPFPKNDTRKLVDFCACQIRGDSDVILEKLLSDIETLNMHRTPVSCLTLLKAQEFAFDRRAINRTKLLEMLLSSIFNSTSLPEYDLEPDVKDCEHVLGAYCEGLIRNDAFSFSEDDFRSKCVQFISHQKIPLKLSTLWTILTDNKILIYDEYGDCRFRFSFWVYYFAAKRMATDDTFKQYVLENRKYAQVPEIIEFYTGITRDRTDVLERIGADLEADLKVIDEKLGIKTFKNPLDCLEWRSKEEDEQKARQQLKKSVLDSSLPQRIKDEHADLFYDHTAPYSQDVRRFLESISFQRFLYQLKTFSRALRNSDYANVEVRAASFKLISAAWAEISKVLFVLTPLLAKYQHAAFLDFRVVLDESFEYYKSDTYRVFTAVVRANPENVIRLVKDDLASDRLGQLCSEFLDGNNDGLQDYLVTFFLVATRPHGWADSVRKVINKKVQGSYFLLAVRMFMCYIYKYATMGVADVEQMRKLLEHILAKNFLNNTDHNHGHAFELDASKQLPERNEAELKDL